MELTELKKIASQVRRDIIRMVHGCQSGHPGGSLDCTDFMMGSHKWHGVAPNDEELFASLAQLPGTLNDY